MKKKVYMQPGMQVVKLWPHLLVVTGSDGSKGIQVNNNDSGQMDEDPNGAREESWGNWNDDY